MWEGNSKKISQKSFYKIVRMCEAAKILEQSDFKNLESDRKTLTDSILDSLLREEPIEIREAKAIASRYLNEYPITQSLLRYNSLDLALAISNLYPDLLASDILTLNEMIGYEALEVAKQVIKDFKPDAVPNDLQNARNGVHGEFRQYIDKKHIFFSAIETKRSYQYHTMFNQSYYDSARYQALKDLEKADFERLQAIRDRARQSVTDADVRQEEPSAVTQNEADELDIEYIDVQDVSDEMSFIDDATDYVSDGNDVETMDDDYESLIDGEKADERFM